MKRENTSSEHEEMKLKDKKKGDKRLRKERRLFWRENKNRLCCMKKSRSFFVKKIFCFSHFCFFLAHEQCAQPLSVISSTSGAAMMGEGESYSTKALALHSAGASDVSRASAKEQLACVCNKASPNVTPSRPKV